jgi:mRNA interferase YafQ
MKKNISYTSQFKKDLEKAKKQARKLYTLQEVIKLLINNEVLPVKFKDHKLIGNYKNHRECHLEPDFLLIYRVNDENLYLERIGTHAELFK